MEALVRLSAALAGGGRARGPVGLDEEPDAALDETLDEAHTHCDALEVEEALLQSYLFLGYPTALNALARWRERVNADASPAGQASPAAPGDWASWIARGEEVCATVYGGQYARLRDHVRRLHPDLETWMVAEGYGKVLGRPGLALDRRELCVVAILAVGGEPLHRQLYAHLRGALNAGASSAGVEAALAVALEAAPPTARVGAREVWQRVLARFDTSPERDPKPTLS
jgi:4-carboxymuconolactone decarboxylase